MKLSVPNGWEVQPLEDLLVSKRDLTYGIVKPGSPTPDGVPIVRVRDVQDGRVRTDGPLRVASEIEGNYQRSRLRGGELLVTLVGTVGATAVAGPELAGWNVARAVAVVRVRQDVGARWIEWVLKLAGSVSLIEQRVNTTVQTTLNLADLRELLVPLPPHEERRGIATTIAALDDKIESNRDAIDFAFGLLDLYARAAAGAGSAAVPLGDIVNVSRETANPALLGDAEVDHYSIPAFDDGARPERTQASSIRSNKLLITQPSILVSRLNPRFNRTWWCVPPDGIPALASTEFIALATSDPGDLGALWLALRDEYFMDELKRRVTGTSGSHQRIRPADVLAIEVPDVRRLPEAEKQRALELLALVHQRRRENLRLARVRDALLPELLLGRIRVPEATEVVEEVAG